MNERLQALAADLRKHSSAELHFDLPTRLLYSTDASSYQITPLAVVIPRHDDDVLATVEACVQLGLPMLPRGSGTSLAGQAVGEAVVIDFTRHFDGVIRIDGPRRRVLVQAGATLDAVNRKLAPYGLMIGPDPASSNRATIGGIVANNSTGAHSIRYGMMADHVVSLRAVLADGHDARLGPLPWAEVERVSRGDSFEAGLYREITAVLHSNADVISARFPRYWRRSGGYNLDRLCGQLDAPELNLAALLTGSEGTLGIVLEAELNLVPAPRHTALGILAFASADAAFRATPDLLTLHPSAIELIDDVLLRLTRAAPGWRERLSFVEGNPAALLVVEFAGDDERAVAAQLLALAKHAQRAGLAAPVLLSDRAGQANVWAVRKAGLNLLASQRGDVKPVPGIEDVAVPVALLADYMADLRRLLDGRGVAAAMYAHASAGCIHVRPFLNLKTSAGVGDLIEITTAAAALAKHYGGVPSSEHGDGLARSYLNPGFFGPEIYDLFRQVKAIFDPANLLNPGKIVAAPAPDQHLRYGPSYQTITLTPALDWSAEGGFASAVEQCNGSGVCRQLDVGAMCPSFQAVRAEMHSTRGRANLLRSALTGQLPGGLDHPALAEALDLCLGCKACKTECPSAVDMTRLKAEAYAQRYRQRRPPLAARAFGNIDRLARIASRLAPVANPTLRFAPTRWLADRALGLHPDRSLPAFARQTFTGRWTMDDGRTFAHPATRDPLPATSTPDDGRRTNDEGRTFAHPATRDSLPATSTPDDGRRTNDEGRTFAHPGTRNPEPGTQSKIPNPKSKIPHPVALFPDTFTEFNEPEQGLAAARVLAAAGCRVELAPRLCCGRPALSQGLVPEAQARARALIDALLPFAEAGIPVIGLEPSCILTIRDDYPTLAPGPAAEAVAANIFLLDEYLAQRLAADPQALRLRAHRRRYLVHGHCHQKALVGDAPTLAVLAAIPGARVEAIAAGCCGMAGAFGYTADHYDVSLAIANDRLIPAVRGAPNAILVANGVSCRHQLADVGGRQAMHVAQALAELLPGDGA